jgi:arsenite methyltransferase
MKTQELDDNEVKTTVRERYGKIAASDGGCGCAPSCCTPDGDGARDPGAIAQSLGYTAEEASAVPEGANLGLGLWCSRSLTD